MDGHTGVKNVGRRNGQAYENGRGAEEKSRRTRRSYNENCQRGQAVSGGSGLRRQAYRLVHIFGSDGRGQNRAGQSRGGIYVQRRKIFDKSGYVGVYGTA